MVSSRAVTKTPWHLWVVGLASLLWNSGGATDYVMTRSHNAAYLAKATPEQIAWFDGFPLWMTIAWTAGVWGAVAGSLLLLLRHRFAEPAFALSFAGLAIGTFYQYGIGHMPASLHSQAGMLFNALLWAVAIALLGYAIAMRRRGVLR